MTITVNAPDGSKVNFPDGTDPKIMAAAMQQKFGGPKSPGILDSAIDAVRSIPGGLAKGVAATAGIPGDIREGGAALAGRVADYFSPGSGPGISAITDTALRPILPSASSTDLNAAASAPIPVINPKGGYYQPQTTTGKYAERVASFAPAALGGEASLAARAARVVVPAAASQAAGDATEGSALQPYAEVAGALAGGGLVAGGRTAIRSVNRVFSTFNGGSGFLDPAAEAARRLSGAVAADGGASAASARAADYASSGASSPALIDVAGNNTRRLVRAAASGEGDGQNIATSYADRVAANLQDNATDRTRQLTNYSPSNASDFGAELAATQSDQARTNYAVPYSQPATVTPQMVSALQGPEGRGAINRAFAAARANRDTQAMGELQDLQQAASDQGGGRDPLTGRVRSLSDALSGVSAGTLDRVRIAMRDIGGGLAQKGAKDIARGYMGRVNDIDTALDQTPSLTDARASYRGTQALIDAVPVGQGALNTPSADYASEVARLGSIHPDAPAAAGVGHRQALLDAIEAPTAGATGVLNRISSSNRSTANLATSFGPQAGSDYQRAIANEVDRVNNARFISPNSGSQTAPRMQDTAALVSSIPHSALGVAMAFVDKLRRGITLTQAERAEIVRMGTSEANLRALAAQPAPINPALQIAAPTAIAASSVH